MSNRAKIVLVLIMGISVSIFIAYKNLNDAPLEEEKIRVAWIGPLSGNTKILGEDNYLAVAMAVKQFNDLKDKMLPKIELKKYDDKYQVLESKKIYEKIRLSFKPHIVFLSTYESLFELSQVFFEDKVIVINPIDNDLKLANLQNNIFLIAKRTEQLASIVSDAMTQDNLQQAAILYFNSDSFMPSVASEIRHQFSKNERVSSLYPYEMNSHDFQSILPCSTLKELDGVALLGYAEMKEAIIHIKKCKKDIKLYSVNTALALAKDPQLIPLIEGMNVAHFTKLDGNIKKAEAFIDLFSSIQKRPPFVDWIAFQAYDAANIVIEALHNSYKSRSKSKDPLFERLKYNLLNGKKYQGISGDITINVDGTSDGIYIKSYIIEKGQAIKK